MGKVLAAYLAPSVLVTITGLTTNLLSLSYFVTQRKNNDRLVKTASLNRKLFILLNVFDIIVCTSVSAMFFSIVLDGEMGRVAQSVFNVAVQCTGFITCLLCMVRTTSIIWPHYPVDTKVLFVAFTCFCLLMIALETHNPRGEKIRYAKFITILLMFAIVILSNILCILKLASSQLASWKREATITIAILSFIYCALNTGFLVVFGIHIFKCKSKNKLTFCVNPTFEVISPLVLLPLNSACNPIVYFIRNVEMRKYMTKIVRKVSGMCTCTRTKSGENVNTSTKESVLQS